MPTQPIVDHFDIIEQVPPGLRSRVVVLHGDVNVLIDNLPDRIFYCNVCNDVLEHLVDPYTALTRLKIKLDEKGVIVVSITRSGAYPF